MQKCGIPFKRKYPRNSTSWATDGLIVGLGGGGGGTILGGVRLEPGLKNGLLATPAQQLKEKSKRKKAVMYNFCTLTRFQMLDQRARHKQRSF